MKGSEGIKTLKLETLNKLIQKFPKPPSMMFSNIFANVPAESDTIRWEVEYGSAGMTPFVAPGSVAPAVGVDGTGEASAQAAYYKEKMFMDEVWLNNLREPGSWATYQAASRKLARGIQKLNFRCDRRREWMCAKMLIEGGFTYIRKGGAKFTVNYGVPATHQLALAADRQWDDGASKNPVEDIFDAKVVMADDAGVSSSDIIATCNSDLLKLLVLDADIQALLKKSAFGEGNLFSNPAQVLGTLLGVGTIVVNDDQFEVPAWLTGNVTGGATTVISVDDATDFEVGGKLRFHDMSEVNVWEDETISAVDPIAGTVTVAAAPTLSFKSGEDKVTMKKKYIGDDKFFMYSTTYEGQAIGEIMEAPYGLARRWGKYVDRKDEWDPEGLWIRVQDKALPVLYHPDTTYTLTVR